MNLWTYQIIDNTTNKILAEDNGYEFETDAEEQAGLYITRAKLANVRIRTFQKWIDL